MAQQQPFILGACPSRVSKDTRSNRQVWPWSKNWSRAKANRVLPRECTNYTPVETPFSNNTRDNPTPSCHQMVNTKNQIDYILCNWRWRGSIISVQFSCSVMSNSLRSHGLQHARPPCPSPTPRVYSVHWVSDAIQPSHPLLSPSPPAISLSQHQGLFQWVSSSLQVAKGASASASVLPMNIQDGFPLGWTGLISLQSKGLSRVFSNTTVQKRLSPGFTLKSPGKGLPWQLLRVQGVRVPSLVRKLRF